MSGATGTNARTYAETLLEVSDEAGVLDTVDEAFTVLSKGPLREPSIQAFFRSVALSPVEKRKVIEDAFNPDKGVPVPLFNLLRILADRRDLSLLPILGREWQNLMDERAGRVRFKITSAREIDTPEIERIAKTVGEALGKHAVAEAKVDASLVGGIVLQIQDTRIDGSIRSRMRRMRALLMEKSAS